MAKRRPNAADAPAFPDTRPPAKRNPNGTFAAGFSGRTAYDAGRARKDLNADTIRAMHKAFREGGENVIKRVMKNQPAIFLKLLVLLVPRELQVEHTGGVKAMTDEQIEQGIEAIKDLLARRAAGEAAKVIEGTPEPAALPAPEAQSIGAGLEPKRQRRPNRLLMEADTAVGSRERISRRVPPPSRA
jgi:hypothetical protein